MNKIFKVIWNRRTQSWVAVPEVTKAQGKTKSSTVMLVAALLTAGTVALGGGFASAAVQIGDGISQNGGTNTAGGQASASGSSAVAIGWGATAPATQGIAIGNDAKANSQMSVAISSSANATGDNSIAIGNKSTANGTSSIAFGYNNTATGNSTVAIGRDSTATGGGSLAIGSGNTAEGKAGTSEGRDASIAIGEGNIARNSGTVIGRHSMATGDVSFVMGAQANALGNQSTAIGSRAVAAANHSNSIGAFSIAESNFSLAIGQQSRVLNGTTASGDVQFKDGEYKYTGTSGDGSRNSTAVGAYGTEVRSSKNAAAFGTQATVTNAERGMSLGYLSTTTAAGGVAIGAVSNANRTAVNETNVTAAATPALTNNEVYALNSASSADKTAIKGTVKGSQGAVSVGGEVTYKHKVTNADGTTTEVTDTYNTTRQIINVAAGTNDSDAVNVAQLKAVANVAESKIGDNNFSLGGNSGTTTDT